MTYEASLRAASPEQQASDRTPAAHDSLPASLYRTIRPGAWLAVLAAGLLGWLLLFALA